MSASRERVNLTGTPLHKRLATEAYIKTVLPLAEKISRQTIVEFPDNFWEAITKSTKAGNLLIVIPGHDSLHNGPSVSLVTRDITEAAQATTKDFKGFVVPVAQSLINGDQGYFLQRLFQEVERDILNKNHLHVIGHTRPKDREVYGTPPNRKEYMDKMQTAIRHNFGVVIFPEGEAGKGLTDFKQDALPVVAKLAKEEAKKPVFIPVGISGDPKVFYQSKIPSADVLRVATGLDTGTLVRVRVGQPIVSDELAALAISRVKSDISHVNRFLGQSIAALLPEEDRGVFRLDLSVEPKKF